MKKIYLLSLIALFFFACNEGTSTDESVKYPFESGIVKYENDVMGMKTTLTLYIKDYGDVECSVSEVELMGKKMTMKSLIKDGYLYSLSIDQKSGTKMKIDQEFSTYSFDTDMFEEKIDSLGGKKLGTEEILGKTCQIYSMMQEGAEQKMWIWKNMLMKMSAEQNGMVMGMEVKSIEETNNFPDGIFDIPVDYNITDEPEMDMDIDEFGDENAAG
ncbi:MAG: hypothetical protein DRI95_10910 [Bacteroidetes bacterium]|nr:MAG: hypothetical protein DRI95_10910 [Bacteroidota bacterium]RLD84915.1 MAG: hypothetical protein DRJ07_04235 [Bacteroidota bacterium]